MIHINNCHCMLEFCWDLGHIDLLVWKRFLSFYEIKTYLVGGNIRSLQRNWFTFASFEELHDRLWELLLRWHLNQYIWFLGLLWKLVWDHCDNYYTNSNSFPVFISKCPLSGQNWDFKKTSKYKIKSIIKKLLKFYKNWQKIIKNLQFQYF